MTKQTTDHTGWYANYFKAWRADFGTRPTNDQLAIAHVFGKPGKQSLALALTLRSEGVTAKQILAVIAAGNGGKGKPQNNHRNGLVEGKLFKRLPVPPNGNAQVYKLELTASGAKRVEKAVSEADKPADEVKPVKASKVAADKKPASKPRKPKGKPVEVEPVTVIDTGGISDSAGHNNPAFEVEPVEPNQPDAA